MKLDLSETMPVGRSELTQGGMIRHYCLCGAANYHEVGEVGRIVSCVCNRMYCVPSPPSLALCDVHRFREQCQTVRTPAGKVLLLKTPIVDFGRATTPRFVEPAKRNNWIVPFLCGLIVGLALICILTVSVPSLTRLFR